MAGAAAATLLSTGAIPPVEAATRRPIYPPFRVHATYCENRACEPVTLQISSGERFVMYRWGNHREEVRIANIDAPDENARCPREKENAQRATDRLGQLLNGSIVTLARIDVDLRGNSLAFVSVDSRDLGHQLISEHLALPREPKHRSRC